MLMSMFLTLLFVCWSYGRQEMNTQEFCVGDINAIGIAADQNICHMEGATHVSVQSR